MFAGGLSRVEKVKPDPLNLLVKTDVGKQITCIFMKVSAKPADTFFY